MMGLLLLFIIFYSVRGSEDTFNLTVPLNYTVFEWKPPSLLEIHMTGFISTHPILVKWDEHWNRSVFLQRTSEQAMKLQTNMLRDHILRHMYASTHMITRIHLPSYTTRPSLCAIRMELEDRGFKSRIG
jgi:hypothetical protein